MKRIERKSKPKKCPKCGHSPVGKILWGMPRMDSKLEELMDTGKNNYWWITNFSNCFPLTPESESNDL
jgi:hypothetical protein